MFALVEMKTSFEILDQRYFLLEEIKSRNKPDNDSPLATTGHYSSTEKPPTGEWTSLTCEVTRVMWGHQGDESRLSETRSTTSSGILFSEAFLGQHSPAPLSLNNTRTFFTLSAPVATKSFRKQKLSHFNTKMESIVIWRFSDLMVLWFNV